MNRKKTKKETLQVDTKGFRTDLNDYFRLYVFIIKPTRAQESPFVVVDGGRVSAVSHAETLLSDAYSDDARIFHTWPGQYKADVFTYCKRDMVDWFSEHRPAF